MLELNLVPPALHPEVYNGQRRNMAGDGEFGCRRPLAARLAARKDYSAMAHLERALEIATAAHDGQKDKTDRPYIEHLQRVAEAVDTLDEKIVAYLHDVIEKGPGCTRAGLEAEGFSPAVTSAVDALTRRDGEDDDMFVRRAGANRLARPVKRADLEDNLRQALAAGLPSQKYRRGLEMLDREFSGSGKVVHDQARRPP